MTATRQPVRWFPARQPESTVPIDVVHSVNFLQSKLAPGGEGGSRSPARNIRELARITAISFNRVPNGPCVADVPSETERFKRAARPTFGRCPERG